MATGPRYNVAFRRRREGRTNYYTRRKLLASHETRAVVRRSNKNITVQFADFTMTGDKIIAAADTKQFKALGWEHSCSSIPAAYLVGYAAGLKAKKAGVEYAVLDLGMQNPQHGGVLFAVAKGIIDAGVEVPASEDVFPDEDRINGKHIDDKIEADVASMKQKLEAE
ncbi:50S ribosomal protein L18 [Candidatus Methanomethylophilus sp. 1R26]|jgi:large subunit ribosomal protein L18|uniref:50S ribosomal protein L18 n=1 Tax=Candidatus Methanomethylophilus sp. 1R26 TaxID=1769296 RepID=UPI0007361FFC|nr:50S ribosomal protein L18 [Candidatus Methanomethylophilus sp. 1R26]MCH3978280.1 50S ribosomal protein L18 [Methanomethylophilus sp.]TQS83128.1 MAG: 50S ribosomal protein L18 [Methanomethylophilus alvi]WII08904.1 50S ribosomal protein L18 [Methanomassiliicoccales archaeon LGM-DZ1]KUE74167.1 50S ribosomal protein L18 [Candidatus Methanomethylophilus sp. 1R26]MCI2075402.1 50S ribosomal protein L18 [Methanomethylophilus sp.]